MELALYCPVCGFYEKENDTIGRGGDFYTSVSVGSLFGELLAFQFADWLAPAGANCERGKRALRIVEAGAHDGKLAGDILTWLLLRRPELAAQVEYWIVEPSARRQERQRETLREFAPRVQWAVRLSAIGHRPTTQVRGVIFSNELLDAMPVHRLGWDAQRREWFEWGVSVEREEFVWRRLPKPLRVSRLAFHVPPELLAVLPDGFTTEICPAAENWWREAAGLLSGGKLLTIDYGLNAEEVFTPGRKAGTLRAYRQHRLDDNVLANPGEQDLTAHVNFTAIQSAGEEVGLKTERFDTQARFLTEIAGRAWHENNGFGPWTSNHTRQFQTLTHPEFLGRSFRVLVQAR